MPLILNIETSTDICSVCLAMDGEILSIRETERSYSHSEVIAVFIDECIREAGFVPRDLEAVAISRGPGSYTALRIGSSTAKGICYALDIPMIAIDTMRALAHSLFDQAQEDDLIIPLIDARRQEVYMEVFDKNRNVVEEVKPIILDSNSFLNYKEKPKLLFCGDGVTKAKELIKVKNGIFTTIECSSQSMVEISEEKFVSNSFEDIAYFEPMYYKGPNITVQKKNILQ